ncbi:MAG TPA: class I SAM-dependent methyltransferase [Candidatus Baltobacteraceae bacterium]|nr:class I SAM-dependent methyltransferase [Candidatus Baltobacteraceae bacterium]
MRRSFSRTGGRSSNARNWWSFRRQGPIISDHVARNRAYWNAWSDDYQQLHGAQLEEHRLAWGTFSIPEDELRVLGDVRGKDVLEYGCGAAQWSIGLTLRGARCTGLDLSERQLEHARENMRAAGVDFPLICASAEDVPLPDGSFDIVFCDHGAMTFADPHKTVPQVSRLLRSGGIFAFSAGTPLHFICWDQSSDRFTGQLAQPYFGHHASDDGESVVFSLPYGEWIRLFRRNGLVVEDLIELRPPDGAETTYTNFVDPAWARQWPAEQIWKLRKA